MRGVTNGWMSIWDLAKPVIAQVHSYCLAGGSELATGCDLVYVAEDAKIGYPAVRFGTPDMQYHAWLFGMRAGMESMLTGDSFSGIEAAQLGWANRAYPEAELEENVLAIATRIAQIPTDLVQINKRTVHRAMEVMGLRSSIRAGTELSALATHTESMKKFVSGIQSSGLRSALTERDTPFGDYRTSEPRDDA
jgi:enoyl-CoA hydratase